jgi:release factor glutamine methyltransferase
MPDQIMPDQTSTVGDLLKQGIAKLQGVSGTPRSDVQTMIAHVIDKPREYIIAHTEAVLTADQLHTFEKLLTLRSRGMPLAYIVGRRAFFDRDFRINPHVLIPRPETEHVVEEALEWVKGRPVQLVDVGTGSGVIALTLAAKLPNAQVLATDVSAAALLVARENAAGLQNVTFIQGDLLAPLHGSFDVICANLPYIATGEMNVLDVAKFEPHVALDGGGDGLVLIRKLLDQAPSRLAKPGLLLMEHGADQGPAVAELAQKAFPDANVRIVKDLAGLDRVTRVEQ